MHTARDPSTSSRAAAGEGRSKPLEPIRVLIGGDYPLYLTGLANLVRKHANLDLADVVSSEDIVTTLTDLKSGVAVLGPFKPGRAREAEILANAMEHVRVVFVSGEPEPTIYAAIGAGAMGCLTPTATSQEILGILEGVAVGQRRFSSDAQDALLGLLGREVVDQRRFSPNAQDALGREVHERARAARPPITAKEREVLRLMGEGLSSVEIGNRLYITKSTVKTHQHKIYGKLGVNNGNAAVVAALRHWLI
jgi:DNA-binding NarL/FixJ family response regulator